MGLLQHEDNSPLPAYVKDKGLLKRVTVGSVRVMAIVDVPLPLADAP